MEFATISSISSDRKNFSQERIEELRHELLKLPIIKSNPSLTIYCAGSYGRHEASKYSDIDLFFFDLGSLCKDISDIPILSPDETNKLFGDVKSVIQTLNYPNLTEQFLKLMHIHDVLNELGSQDDDSKNTFTARMLLLLESKCLVNQDCYNVMVEELIKSYFRDYPEHEGSFRPLFFINDIIRYWKTLCLNYEHKRNQPAADEKKKISQKVKNFKLKFSRMTTCYATIAALSNNMHDATEKDVIELVKLTPRERLSQIPEKLPSTLDKVKDLLEQYDWFLEQTALTTEELHSKFSEKSSIQEMFAKAEYYGNTMFSLLEKADEELKIFRYLVI